MFECVSVAAAVFDPELPMKIDTAFKSETSKIFNVEYEINLIYFKYKYIYFIYKLVNDLNPDVNFLIYVL